MALVAYRNLLRAARVAFQGDDRVLHAAFAEARQGFEPNRGLPPGSTKAKLLIQEAQEMVTILRKNVVQGKMGPNARYKLRIIDETEMGDNKSIKTPGTSGGKGCSS